MRKKILAAMAALGVLCLHPDMQRSAQAIQIPGGADADRLVISESGAGHMLIIPYFSTQAGNATLITLVNTDEVNGKAVKLRFRGARNADSLFDFQVFLAAGDAWTANVSQLQSGYSSLTSEDASCTRPPRADINGKPFSVARLNPQVSEAERANGTREGYIEIVNMADIPQARTGLYPLIELTNSRAICADGVANNALTALDTDLKDVAAYGAIGMTAPTTGLIANWTLTNVPAALSWSGVAMPIEARKGDVPAKGNISYFPQSSKPANNPGTASADPLFAGASPVVTASWSDLPDISTPYVAGVGGPNAQLSAIADLLAVRWVVNEYWTEPTIHAATDWLFTMPTRRFAVGIDYRHTARPRPVFNDAVAAHFAPINVVMNGDAACLRNLTFESRDREGANAIDIDDHWIFPTPYAPTFSCGSTSTTSFNPSDAGSSKVVSSSVSLKVMDTGHTNGWFSFDSGYGLHSHAFFR
ncbi:hypothetical protein [Diaphorobacter aerolatus]|uniref:Cell surface protein n=1 Tax=Diaphorobacter aerolatus TaxID=1288495 RepID=A0A7H0GHC8_9BURK|nr:hypothetical protein [Diaphorobacter aerolatus]QNP47694.1 hypothetical protein H9K75_16055 [Diaphorobacter aerolatus]